MAAVAKYMRQTGEVFGLNPPRDRQFRLITPRTKYGYTLTLRIMHYEDNEYMVDGHDGWSDLLFNGGGIRVNDSYVMLLQDLEQEVMNIVDPSYIIDTDDKENDDPNIDAMDA